MVSCDVLWKTKRNHMTMSCDILWKTKRKHMTSYDFPRETTKHHKMSCDKNTTSHDDLWQPSKTSHGTPWHTKTITWHSMTRNMSHDILWHGLTSTECHMTQQPCHMTICDEPLPITGCHVTQQHTSRDYLWENKQQHVMSHDSLWRKTRRHMTSCVCFWKDENDTWCHMLFHSKRARRHMLSCGVATEDRLPGKCLWKCAASSLWHTIFILKGRMDLADDELKRHALELQS